MNAILEQVRVGIHAVWRRRWLALAIAWAIALLGWLVISLIPNTYESVAKFYVEPQSIIQQAVGINPNDQQQGIDAVKQTLLSSDNLQQVIRQTDLSKQVTSDKALAGMVARLQKAIDIKSPQDNMFQVSVDLSGGGFSDAQNAKLAQQIVYKLLDLFVSTNGASSSDEAERSLKFLDAQLAERGAQLQDAEQKQQAFDQKYMGMLPGSGSIQDRIDAARSQMSDVETNLAAAQSSLAAINGQIAATPATVPGPAGMGGAGGARERLGQLQSQLAADQAQGWTDQHPDVIALKSQIARMGPAAAAEPSGGSNPQPNPSYVSLRSMVAEKQANVAALSSRHAQIQADLNAFATKQVAEPEVTAQQAQLSRDHDVLKAQYDKLLQDREGVKLRADAQSQAGAVVFRLIQPPTLSKVPAKPKRPLLLSGVLLLAIAGGAGAAFLRAKLQTSFSTPAALAMASGLPVLGAVTFVRGPRQKARETQQLKWFAGAGGALVGAYVLLMGVEFVQRAMMG